MEMEVLGYLERLARPEQVVPLEHLEQMALQEHLEQTEQQGRLERLVLLEVLEQAPHR